VLFENLCALATLAGLDGQAVMLAITAPGTQHVYDPATGEVICEGIPWDEAWCSHRGPHKHSGPDGCRADPLKATAWNLTADERWSKLHRRAATETRRIFGNDGLMLLCRALEKQKRGLKHFHPALAAATPRQRQAVVYYRERLAELAPSYGFGFVSEKIKPQSARAAAAYLSSYFVTGKRNKTQLQESVTDPALARSRLLWVNPKLTMRTGVTMRELRFRRFVWVRYGGLVRAGGEWIGIARRLAEIERDRGAPLTGDEVVRLVDHLRAGADVAGRVAA
jgi:hypothetical protein